MVIRDRGRALGRCATAAALACCAVLAAAEPVWLTVGAQIGQGQTFVLDGVCYAYTAGHVVRKRGTEVVLTDREAFQTKGRTLVVDEGWDLGLVKVDEPASRARKLCSTGRPPEMARVKRSMQRFKSESPDVWLDMVSTPAGGLSRFELDLKPAGSDAQRLALAPGKRRKAAQEELATQSGDSGASIWMSDRDTERSRYTAAGDASVRTSGLLLGVHLGVKDGLSVAVPADVLHEFIFDHLQPVDWERIAIEPAFARLVQRQRGDFGVETRDHILSVSDRQLDHASFELDLGDADVRVVAVRVDMASTAPGLTSAGRRSVVKVSTSQYRPGEQARARWDRGDCERSTNARAPQTLTIECRLRDPRIARGVRVEFAGNPAALRKVAVVKE